MDGNYISSDVLMHYGVGKMDGAPGRGSGRYPLGSGDNPYQHGSARDFIDRVNQLKDDGNSETEIAKILFGKFGTTTQLRTYYSLAKDEKRSELVATARRLQSEGLNTTEIARKMGYANESSVRSLLNDGSETRMKAAKTAADYLKDVVDKKGMVDVSIGVEKELGISREKLNQALELLKIDGYKVYPRGVPQVTNPGKQTNINVLCVPGTEYKDIYNTEKIKSVMDYEKMPVGNGEETNPKYVYPASMDSKRVMIRYADENGGGGNLKDGVLEIRRGVDDLNLGNSHYAQVRILVDGTHYLKGMAVYGEDKDFPDGVDIIFNTNKKSNVDKMDVLKKIGSDPDNPFGALIKKGGQSYYTDKNGEKKLSLINKTNEEGDWGEWSRELSAQFLAKQSKDLIQKQLKLATADKLSEFDEIKSLTNPTVKKRLLLAFADNCDYTAEHLEAAALPRQRWQIILPVKSLKDNECFAPNYENGETVALIRYPHGGIFEIPVLKVNNKNKEGLQTIGNGAKDAIGINKKNADKLSGADFDGDTALVIPVNSKVKIQSKDTLKDLEGFDTKIAYGPESTDIPYKLLSKKERQKQMGMATNLIMDMTIKGAPEEHIVRAVKHSMVIIDAEKHKLDYKRSEKENNIAELKKIYQGRIEDGKYTTGASTLITRAKSPVYVPKTQGSPKINPEDGSLSYKLYDKLYFTDKNGKQGMRTQKSYQMRETKDARKLSSGTPKEELYASYANQMKSLANEARKLYLNAGKIEYKRSARETYSKEVDHLNAQLDLAERNAPRERTAHLIANARVDAKVKDNPYLEKKDIQKIQQQEITRARELVGAKRHPITINDREWEAIQAGAISETKLSKILNHADLDEIRERAMPRSTNNQLTSAKIAKIKLMNKSGYTNKEIAKALGVSSSTVSKYL